VEPLGYLSYVFAACLIILVVPGQVFFLSINEALRGFRAGVKMLFGVASAMTIPVVLLAAGFALLLQQLLVELMIVGAAFLIWIVVSAIRTALKGGGEYESRAGSAGNSFSRRFAMTALNPPFVLWLLTVGSSMLRTGVESIGRLAYPIFGLAAVGSSSLVCLIIIFLISRGFRMTGKRGLQALEMISGPAFVILGCLILAPLFG